MLSKAFDKSSNTRAISSLQSIDSRIISEIRMFTVSVERSFLLPLSSSVKLFLLITYSVNIFIMTGSRILDASTNRDTGQLLFGISWSPSFPSGMTSAFFHAVGKTEKSKEQLTICVSIGRIQGRTSLITDIGTLSTPGALLEEKDITI